MVHQKRVLARDLAGAGQFPVAAAKRKARSRASNSL